MSKGQTSNLKVQTGLRSAKRKLEAHGEPITTDNGVPRFPLKSLLAPVKQGSLPDYYDRLLKQQPRALTPRHTRKLHEKNRGDR